MADYEDVKVTDLVINNISQEKYDELKTAGQLEATQIYLTPTEEGGDSLPDQTDNAGKFLMTDGTTVSWGNAIKNSAEDPATDIEILTTNITDTNILIGGARKGNESVTNAIAIGSKYSGVPTTAGKNAIAIGRDAMATENASIAIGFGSYVPVAGGIAIGNWARVNAAGSIQLNARYSSLIDNNEEGTFNVALGTINGGGGNYKLLDIDGKVPLDRLTYVTDQIGDISTALTAILGE